MASVHGLVGDGGHHGRAVDVQHRDRHLDAGGQRHAGAVAVVGRGERDDVVACVGVAGRPGEQGRVRIERRPSGQAADGVGDGGLGAVERRQGAVGGP